MRRRDVRDFGARRELFTTRHHHAEVIHRHADNPIAEGVDAKLLFEKELAGFPGQQVTVTQVSYPPGLESQAHKHHGPVFVYVVEGVMELQVSGGAVTTVKAGETFYEPPGGTHVVSRNASKTKPAKLVAFIVGKAGTPVTGPPSGA